MNILPNIIFGLYLHIKKYSILDLNYNKLPTMQPNISSVIFTFSILYILSLTISNYVKELLLKRCTIKSFIYLFDIIFTVYLTEIILRYIWLPINKLLYWFCYESGKWFEMKVMDNGRLLKSSRILTIWLKTDAFYIFRFTITLWLLYEIINFTGILSTIKMKLCNWQIFGDPTTTSAAINIKYKLKRNSKSFVKKKF